MKRISAFFLLLLVLSCMSLSALAANDTTDYITVVVPRTTPTPTPTPTPTLTLTPIDLQTTDLDNETRQIVKTYNVLLDLDYAPLIPETFDADGITYSRTDLTAEDMIVTDTKAVTVNKTLTAAQKVGASAFAGTINYSTDGYTGTLARQANSFSVWSSGTKQVRKTVTATKKYSSLPRNDMSQIAKSYNGLTLINVDWYDQNTGDSVSGYTQGQPGPYGCTAHYSGVQTSTVSTGYAAKVDYSGNVTKETVTGRAVKAVYIGKIPAMADDATVEPIAVANEAPTCPETPVAENEPPTTTEPENMATESTPTSAESGSTPIAEAPLTCPVSPMFPAVSVSVLFTAGLLELIHLIARRVKK